MGKPGSQPDNTGRSFRYLFGSKKLAEKWREDYSAVERRINSWTVTPVPSTFKAILIRTLVTLLLLALASAVAGRAQTLEESVPGSPQLHAVSVGSGVPTVVVLHGGPGFSHRYLRPEWEHLGKKHQTIFYDQRGCGLSEQSAEYGWREHIADVERVVAHFSPYAPVVLAGSSWGAVLALLYAREHPGRVRALVLSGMPRRSGQRGGTPMFSDEFLARLGPRCMDVASQVFASLRDRPTAEQFRGLRIPVLMVVGAQEMGEDEFSAVLPEVVVSHIEDTGHDPWYDQPGAFFAVVEAFLRELP